MNDRESIVSGFEGEGRGEAALGIDFATARRLGSGGSTCEAFVATFQRRRVFVKRLKAEFRDNPLYRAAFDKEFDLGVSLSHPSLPRYVGFGGDYIAMDFIEGDTLADLLARGDRRLRDRRFTARLLADLVGVVEYLHRRNIVHCDIKPDNIIVSPYDDRPATLIDLDKAYTSWLADTPGDPAKYGCSECADGAIDFRGIGMIASRLGHRRLASACRGADVAVENLRQALRQQASGRGTMKWVAIAGVLLLCAALAAVWLWPPRQSAPTAEPPRPTIALRADSASPAAPGTPPKPRVEAGGPRAPGGAAGVDAIVSERFGRLARRHEYLATLAADSAATSRQLRAAFAAYAADLDTAQNAVVAEVMERYGLANPLEAHSLLATSAEWGRFMARDMEVTSLYSREIDRRTATQAP